MTNQSVFGSGSRLVYDILMNSENRAVHLPGAQRAPDRRRVQRLLHNLRRHHRRERHRSPCWFHRSVLLVHRRRRGVRHRLRSVDAGHRRDHLHRPVADQLQRRRSAPGSSRGRSCVPHDRQLLLLVHAGAWLLRVLHRAHHLQVLLQLDAGAHRERAGTHPDRARAGATPETRTAAASRSPSCRPSTSRRWTSPSSTPRSVPTSPNLTNAAGQQRFPHPGLLLRPREVPVKSPASS
jgi:hypothetical protein